MYEGGIGLAGWLREIEIASQSDFQRRLGIGKEAEDKEKQCERNKKLPRSLSGGKPQKSGSFIRNWGGWLTGDE